MKKSNLYAVILAGGTGTRFWPVSRKANPKQFLKITGQATLLQETLARISPRIQGRHIYIVTNAAYRRAIQSQSARYNVPKANILLEPEGKNTAPAICWAAARIHASDPDAVMVVLPSDHLILNRKKFLAVLTEALHLAGQDFLVTLGIVPTRPETGYGYLKTTRTKLRSRVIQRVARFTEKPSLAKARGFVKKKNYYWNSGMFVWKSAVILDAFRDFLPEVYRSIGTKASGAQVRKVWRQLPSISVDYGILEKAKNVAAVPAPGIQWSDLGSWESLAEVLPKDRQGNILKGDIIAVDSTDSVVWGNQKVIACVGLDNIIVIDTPDALLVCRKNRSQDVKNVVSILQRKNRRET